MQAVGTDNGKSVESLIRAGADVNEQNEHGNTALIPAASVRADKCTDVLIREGADVNKQDNFGNTALIVAASLWEGSESVEVKLKQELM